MDIAAAYARAERILADSAVARYLVAAAFALAALAFRVAFDPLLGPGTYYFLHYPVILVIAYMLGLGPGLLAIAIIGAISYTAFGQAAAGASPEIRTTLRLFLFLGSATIVAYVAAHVRRQLRSVSVEVRKASTLAASQADLFREHAARVSDHLQFIAALLQMRADGERVEGDYTRALMNAASRTMLISRMHRSFVGDDDHRVDFCDFAQRLADAALAANGHPPILVSVEGELHLPTEPATSLALVLLECINAKALQNGSGALHITLSQNDGEGALTIVEEGASDLRERDMRLVGALAEQMRGRLVLGGAGGRGMLRFAFPAEVQPLPTWRPLTPLN